uniref:Uncharacterized protein n=1 Tax=Arundo donax TaxID=35708 RepID=A0A0A9GZY5_ARUDO
MGKERRIRA